MQHGELLGGLESPTVVISGLVPEGGITVVTTTTTRHRRASLEGAIRALISNTVTWRGASEVDAGLCDLATVVVTVGASSIPESLAVGTGRDLSRGHQAGISPGVGPSGATQACE